MTSSTKQSLERFWEAVYTSFNPIEPVSEPELRVPRDGAYSPAEGAVRSLLSPFDTRRILVAGSMGFMRRIAEQAHGIVLERVDADLVNSIIDAERRRRSDGLNDDEIKLLEGLARDPAHRLPGSDIAISLLEQQLILSYPNEDAWYLPHPLLMITLIRPG